jgi:hypothetical protein
MESLKGQTRREAGAQSFRSVRTDSGVTGSGFKAVRELMLSVALAGLKVNFGIR